MTGPDETQDSRRVNAFFSSSFLWRLTADSNIRVEQLTAKKILVATSTDGKNITAMISSDPAVHEVHILPTPDSDTKSWFLRLSPGITPSTVSNQEYKIKADDETKMIVAMPNLPHRTAFLIFPEPDNLTDAEIAEEIRKGNVNQMPLGPRS